jgi:hypothetical protein
MMYLECLERLGGVAGLTGDCFPELTTGCFPIRIDDRHEKGRRENLRQP